MLLRSLSRGQLVTILLCTLTLFAACDGGGTEDPSGNGGEGGSGNASDGGVIAGNGGEGGATGGTSGNGGSMPDGSTGLPDGGDDAGLGGESGAGGADPGGAGGTDPGGAGGMDSGGAGGEGGASGGGEGGSGGVPGVPPVPSDDTVAVDEGATFTGNVLTNDTDADSDTLTAMNASTPSYGTVTLEADGAFTYVHDGSESTTDSFTYDACADGDCVTATVSVTITPVDDVPMIVVAETVTAVAGVGQTITVPFTVEDPDTAQSELEVGAVSSNPTLVRSNQLTVSPPRCPPGDSGCVAPLPLTRNRTLYIQPIDGQVGSSVLTLRMFVNGELLSQFIQFTVTSPTGVTASTLSVSTGGNTLLEFGGSAGSAPAVHMNGSLTASVSGHMGTLTFSAPSVTAGARVNLQSTGTFTYEPPVGFTGMDSFTYQVCDQTPACTTGTVNVQVIGKHWFIRSGAAGGGDGRSTTPFNALTAAQTASTAGDTLYVATGTGTITGQLTLKDDQILTGAGEILVISSGVEIPAATRPTLTGAGPTLTLANRNTVRGVLVASTGVGIAATGVAGPSVINADIDVDGLAVDLSQTSGSFMFNGTVSAGGLRASNTGATAPTLTFNADVVVSSGSVAGLDIRSTGAGTTEVSFADSLMINTTTGTGVFLNGSSVTVSSGAVTSSAGPGVVGTNCTLSGSLDSVSAGQTALALDTCSTDSGLFLVSVSAAGGDHGVRFDDVTGSVEISGSGTVASGGTLTGSAAAAVSLNGSAGLLTFAASHWSLTGSAGNAGLHYTGSGTSEADVTCTSCQLGTLESGYIVDLTDGAAANFAADLTTSTATLSELLFGCDVADDARLFFNVTNSGTSGAPITTRDTQGVHCVGGINTGLSGVFSDNFLTTGSVNTTADIPLALESQGPAVFSVTDNTVVVNATTGTQAVLTQGVPVTSTLSGNTVTLASGVVTYGLSAVGDANADTSCGVFESNQSTGFTGTLSVDAGTGTSPFLIPGIAAGSTDTATVETFLNGLNTGGVTALGSPFEGSAGTCATPSPLPF